MMKEGGKNECLKREESEGRNYSCYLLLLILILLARFLLVSFHLLFSRILLLHERKQP